MISILLLFCPDLLSLQDRYKTTSKKGTKQPLGQVQKIPRTGTKNIQERYNKTTYRTYTKQPLVKVQSILQGKFKITSRIGGKRPPSRTGTTSLQDWYNTTSRIGKKNNLHSRYIKPPRLVQNNLLDRNKTTFRTGTKSLRYL